MDTYLILMLPALLALLAQLWVRRSFQKYDAQPNREGVNGLTAAGALLASQGLTDVAVERTEGAYSDHYDPEKKTLRLSGGVADGRSVTALSIVAHEVGHAVQDARGYRVMKVRNLLARRLTQIGAWSPFVFVGGMLLGIPLLMGVAVIMLAGQAVFALVTLPVERNASDRAMAMLEQTGMAAPAERTGVRSILRAAALTYMTGLGQKVAIFLFVVVAVILAQRAA